MEILQISFSPYTKFDIFITSTCIFKGHNFILKQKYHSCNKQTMNEN